MQADEQTPISTALHPPKVWERLIKFIPFLVMPSENFFHHMNNIHQNLFFMTEEKSNGEQAFLDT